VTSSNDQAAAYMLKCRRAPAGLAGWAPMTPGAPAAECRTLLWACFLIILCLHYLPALQGLHTSMSVEQHSFLQRVPCKRISAHPAAQLRCPPQLRQQPATVLQPCRVEQLSWKPRAWVYHSFMSAEECDHIIGLAAPRMARSTVVDSETGDSVLDPIRTSQGTFLS